MAEPTQIDLSAGIEDAPASKLDLSAGIEDSEEKAKPEETPTITGFETTEAPSTGVVGEAGKGFVKSVAAPFAGGMTGFETGYERPGQEVMDVSAMQKAAQEAVTPRGTAQTVGYAGGTLLQFLAGDAAFANLAPAEQLLQAGKIAQVLSKYPRLANALRAGAAMGKGEEALSPAEQAVIKAYPTLGRLVKAGMEAVRTGTTAGVQTLATTKSPEEAGKAAVETAGGVGILGAAAAPAESAIATTQPLGKGLFGKIPETIERASELSAQAPKPETVVDRLASQVTAAEKLTHTNYEADMRGLSDFISGREMPYADSPLQMAARKLQGGPTVSPMGKIFEETKPGSPEANRLISSLAEGKFIEGTGEEAVEIPIENVSIEELTQRYRDLNKRQRAAVGTPDWEVYSELKKGVHDTIQQLVTETGDSHAMRLFNRANKQYAESRSIFDNRLVKQIMSGNKNDAIQTILSGTESRENIEQLRKALGPIGMGNLADDIMRTWINDSKDFRGNFDPQAFMNKWNSKKVQEARDVIFGTDPRESPAFRSWFGNSKIVDNKGNPQVVYHGTRASTDFDEFSTTGIVYDEHTGEPLSSGSGAEPSAFLGAHFAQEKGVANKFAMGEGWMKARGEAGEEHPRVIPVYLSLKNPMTFPSEGPMNRFIFEGFINDDNLISSVMEHDGIEGGIHSDSYEGQRWLKNYENNHVFRAEVNERILSSGEHGEIDELHGAARDLADQAKEKMKKLGYDGVKYGNDIEGGTSIIAFEPNQIKSAIGNSGAFDATSGKFADANRVDREGYMRLVDQIKTFSSYKKLVKYGVLPAVVGGTVGSALTPLAHMSLALSAGGAEVLANVPRISALFDYVAEHPTLWKSLSSIGSFDTAGKLIPASEAVRAPAVIKMKHDVGALVNHSDEKERQRNIMEGARGPLTSP